MSLPPLVPLAHETPQPDRPIVVAANRLPVMRSSDGWTASPGGLVRALLPMLRDTGGTWVVADFVDVVVHLFEPGQRAWYDLDGLWADAPRVTWKRTADEKPRRAARVVSDDE